MTLTRYALRAFLYKQHTDNIQHVVSRKHRKFAVTTDNWVELDQLLAQLDRR